MKRIIAAMLCAALLVCALPALAQNVVYSYATSVYGAGSARRNNILLAADALDGVFVPSGGYFSFNDSVGPRTESRGYLTAVNDRGSKVRGGGVSQVATTLYMALMQLGGDIRYNAKTVYGDRFTGGYVSDGALAIVTDYSSGTDFAFTNLGSDMIINFYVSGDLLFCELSVGYDYGYDYGDDHGAGVLLSSVAFPLKGTDGLRNNVMLASEKIYGTVLYPNQTFSFNAVVGPRSEAYGYVSAVNGRGSKVVGGGVAQVASVLWLAVCDMDDIIVTEKSTYGSRYNQDYVYNSSDAIVTDYKAGTDFAFRYVGSGRLGVYVYVENGYLCCDIYDISQQSFLQDIFS